MIKLVLNTAIAYSIAIGLHAQVKVVNLRTEMLTNPQGIDVALPRLSWQLQSQQRHVVQTHYQIWVSHSKDGLMHGRQLVWNSGRQASSQSLHIPYGGPPLKSGMPYFWKVQVFTNKGAATVSENAYFTTGLLQPQDWMAQWIGMDNPSAWDSISQWSRLSARYLRKEFTANASIKRATVYICGLGMYQLVVNGQRIGNEVLAPNPTDYRKRVQYNTYDVTHALKTGTNAIGVVLGNGRFFTMRQNYKTQKHNNFGYPRLLLQLHIEYANGTSQTVVTDPTWKLNADGPIRTNNEYDGEEYDARKEFAGWTNAGFKDKDWSAAQVVEAPAGKLVAQMAPPMRVMQTIKPVSIKRVSEGRYMLDMGQNFAGWLMLKNLYGKAGHQVVLRFAESLQPNGELFTANLRDAKVTDIYTLKGTGNESWHPAFVYHGFRFVEISNFPGIPQLKQFEGHLIFDDLPSTGSFESGNTVLNQIFKNAWWGIASNYKGMPVDCPQRNERQPWLGDRTVGAQGESYLFGNAALYAKWMQDIEDSQTPEGSIPDVAPAFWNYYTDDVTWPAAFIFISNHLYNQYADAAPIARHYAAMKKWMLYMQQKYMHNYLITRDKYADWCVPPESLELIHAKDSNRLTDGTLIATAYYYKLLQYMQRFALLTNHQPDAELYGQWADSIRIAFQQTFYNKEKRHYSNNTVTANLLPLMFGICPDAERAAVFEKIRHKIQVDNLSHIPTGLIGSQWLMRGLTDYGQTELAYTLASNNTYPSWGYMAAQGATTIWELWNGNTANPGMNSQNHVMLLGDLLTWYFENLAGIRSHKTEVGFKKIIMRPALPEGLPFVKATYQSVHGPITSHWKNTTHQFTWSVTIPANTSATLHFPAQDADEITEGGKPVTASPYIKVVKQEAGLVIMEIQNGQYHFVRHKKWKKGIVKESFIFERASFPESHAATIAETPAGLIAAWFAGTKEGYKDVCIYTSHYKNGTWEPPQQVATGIINDTLRYPTYNPVLYYAPNGELLLFYKIGPNVAGWTGWMMRSKDNGYTWSPREALPDGFLGPIKNKPILLNGVLLCPSSTEKNGWKAHIEMTADFGRTWTKTEALNDANPTEAIQPSILQYANGHLQILCRSRNTTLNQSWSTDGGKTWSPMAASPLPNNNSGTDAVTLNDGRQLLVYNHLLPDERWVKGKGPRTPLNVSVTNDGKTWYASLVLENSPISQYSYPSVIQTNDGMVHVVYTWRRQRIKHVIIDPTQLQMQQIIHKQWPGGLTSMGVTADD